MSNQIPFQTKSGKIVYVEVEDTRVREATSGAHTVLAPGSAASLTIEDLDPGIAPKGDIEKSMGVADKVLQEGVFERVVGVVRELVEDVGGGLMDCQPAPAQVELELSLGIGASGNVVIFKGEANATFKLKMIWKDTPP